MSRMRLTFALAAIALTPSLTVAAAQYGQCDAGQRDDEDTPAFEGAHDDQYDGDIKHRDCDIQLRDGIGNEDRGSNENCRNEKDWLGGASLGWRRKRD